MNDTAKLSQIDKLLATIPSVVGCKNCGGCCGPALMSRLEWRRIQRLTGKKYYEPDKEMTCPLLDRETKRCTVYAVRPAICRLFGAVDDDRMTACPNKARAVDLLSNERSNRILDAVNKLGY